MELFCIGSKLIRKVSCSLVLHVDVVHGIILFRFLDVIILLVGYIYFVILSSLFCYSFR